MFRLAIPALLLVAAGSAAPAAPPAQDREDARLAKALDGFHPGATQDCINRDESNGLESYRGTILYVQGRNKIYRNDVVGGCPGLERDDLVVIKSLSSRICRGDIVTTRARGMGNMTGSCTLGAFTVYTR